MTDTELTTGSGPSGGILKPMGDDPFTPPEFKLPETEEMSLPTISDIVEDLSPNVVLAPSKQDEALEEGPVTIGRTRLTIPSKEIQMRGFHVTHPGTLVAQYRQYKFVKADKGKAHNKTVKLD